jgi:F0F1-type ATP synthase alpha subunit
LKKKLNSDNLSSNNKKVVTYLICLDSMVYIKHFSDTARFFNLIKIDQQRKALCLSIEKNRVGALVLDNERYQNTC